MAAGARRRRADVPRGRRGPGLGPFGRAGGDAGWSSGGTGLSGAGGEGKARLFLVLVLVSVFGGTCFVVVAVVFESELFFFRISFFFFFFRSLFFFFVWSSVGCSPALPRTAGGYIFCVFFFFFSLLFRAGRVYFIFVFLTVFFFSFLFFSFFFFRRALRLFARRHSRRAVPAVDISRK
jgi:hypothetical protein